MSGRKMGDYDYAMEMRKVVKKTVAEEVQRLRPRYRYAVVEWLDIAERKSGVIFNGEQDAVVVNVGSFTFITPGDTVRVEGIGTDKFISDVIGGQELIATKSDVGNSGPGSGEDYYSHIQSTASSLWTINHNLGFHPSVSIVDSAGTQVEGDVVYTSVNQVTVEFSGGFSGAAYLS